ncbi:MAG: hypothetical protein M3010_12500, partial [Candidatus Dormibacteraeota bacterium]|nr:hypothetical protein [Candidatus Dormibacteraeota bacterium]
MRTRMARGGLVATLLATAIPLTAAAGSPAAQPQSAAMYARSQQRGSDELANPDYALRFKPLFTDYYGGQDKIGRVNTDPYRLDWGCADLASPPVCRPRGDERSVWMTNRYGAHIHATL